MAVSARWVRTANQGLLPVSSVVEGACTRVLTALHASSRAVLGRSDPRPSMEVVDTHLARGASNGGVTSHNQGGPYGRTNPAKRWSRLPTDISCDGADWRAVSRSR